MATLRDIRRRIRSVQNTKQITRAMEMVAAAKLRRFQAAAEAGRPYAQRLAQMLREVSAVGGAGDEDRHPFLEVRPVRRRALIVVTADRGLCGSFNANLIRHAVGRVRAARDGELGLILVGRKGSDAFRRLPGEVMERFPEIGREITPAFVGRLCDTASELFLSKKVDRVDILYTQFISAMRRNIIEERLLPIAPEDAEAVAEAAPHGGSKHREFIMEPSPQEIFHVLMPRYLRSRIFTALRESFASEQGARMAAMGNASRNAGDLIDSLTLSMNRARQAAITKELSDIVGASEAITT